MQPLITLGDEVKDIVTGFQGIAIARCEWLHGCARVTVQPPIGKDGKVPESGTFDEMAIRIVKYAKVKGDSRIEKTGGPQDDKAALRR